MLNKPPFLNIILESIAEHIVVIDSNGLIQFANGAWDRFAQENKCLIATEWLGIDYLKVCDESAANGDDLSRQAAAGIRKVINQEQDSFYLEYPCHSPQKQQWFLMRVTPFKFENIEFIAISHLNITERKLAEERLKEMNRINDAKSSFLTSMSHELRTPMSAVLGFSQLLMLDTEHPLTEDQIDSVSQIIDGGNHLLDIINQMLNLASLQAKQSEISHDIINVNQLITQVASFIQPAADKSSILIVNKTLDTPLYYINTDQTKLRQVLLNFASNAIKYNSVNGTLTFSSIQTNTNTIRLCVSDTGNGIPNDFLPELFTPFERLDKAKTNIQGTGIGLSICKELIELMEGEIGVFNNADKGVTFWVEFKLIEN